MRTIGVEEQKDAAFAMDIRKGLTKVNSAEFTLRWGFLGSGNITSDWAKCLKEVPGAELTAVAARSVEKAADFAKQHGVAKSYGSYTELVADPDVDIVYVGTITSLHKEHSLLAIAAGKHVLCEKPLAESHADAQAMYVAAEEKGVMLLEGMWTRFFPALEHARGIIEEGTIGEVRMVQSDFADKCYAVQAAPLGFGTSEPPNTVVAAGTADAVSGAVVQYGLRGCAMLTFPSWASEFAESTEITGTKGRITLDAWGHCPTRLTLRTCPAVCWEEPQGHTSTSQNGIQPDMEQHVYPVPEPAGYPAPGWHYSNQHGFIYQAQAVHRCLAAGILECPQYTKAESLQVMKILEQIEQQVSK